jgi:hypothetical protein
MTGAGECIRWDGWRHVGHRHDVYDVTFLASRIAGLILVVRWFQNDQKERRGQDSAWRFLHQR